MIRFLSEVTAKPIVKPEFVKQSVAPVKQSSPCASVRSSPEAFRAYHREDMRKRRAAAKAQAASAALSRWTVPTPTP
jgi:hypothetical protein